MPSAETLRQNVSDMIVRLLAGGEDDLAANLIHPDFVNHEHQLDAVRPELMEQAFGRCPGQRRRVARDRFEQGVFEALAR